MIATARKHIIVVGSSLMVLASALALMAWVTWSLVYPFDPLQVREHNLEVITDHVRRGEQLIVWLDYCKSMPVHVRVDTMIEVGGALFVLQPQYPPTTTGCRKVKAPLVTIPVSLPVSVSGLPATVTVGYHYQINRLRAVDYTYKTNEFIIDP